MDNGIIKNMNKITGVHFGATSNGATAVELQLNFNSCCNF